MFLKSKRHRSKKILDSARGSDCTLRLDCCNYNPETTVFAHISFIGGKMGGKPSDIFGCYACSSCHDCIDRRFKSAGFDAFTFQDMARAIQETQTILLDQSLIKI